MLELNYRIACLIFAITKGNVMDILIVGNGFDIAHGLNTKYKDFLDYCTKNSLEDCQYGLSEIKRIRETNLWFKHFVSRCDEMGNNWIDLEAEIFNAIKYISSNQPTGELDSPNSAFRRVFYAIPTNNCLFSFYNLQDIYKPIKEVENGIDFRAAESSFDENFVNLKGYMFAPIIARPDLFNVLIQNPKALVTFLYDQLREFTHAFEEYLQKVELPKLKDVKFHLNFEEGYNSRGVSDLFLLSFNYTDTCERLYAENSDRRGFNMKKVMYIHGKIHQDNNCNLVLGTKSFYEDAIKPSDNTIDTSFAIFQKHHQRHKNNTIETYQEFLRFLTNPRMTATPVFHIIGHSLDESDHNILKHILLAHDKAIIKLYYHDEASQDALIKNITKIISEKEVMARVQLIAQHDPQRGILKPRNSQYSLA